MQKIPTMFVRDETAKGHPVTMQIKPECQWVLDGEGIATVKIDGTNVKVDNGELFKRQKPKDRDYDEASYVPCDRGNPADKWAWEAYDKLIGVEWDRAQNTTFHDGIYELVGPKIQGNPQQHASHSLVRVVPCEGRLCIVVPDRSFDGLRRWLTEHPVEGVVFHHPDGRMAKIKRRDFGLTWPVALKASSLASPDQETPTP